MDVYQLTHARADRVLGPGISPTKIDCDAIAAELRKKAAVQPVCCRRACPAVRRCRPGGREPIEQAIRDLGFRLDSGRGPVPVLVIDRIERPTPD